MADGVRQVAALPDPVGRILSDEVRPNGLRLVKTAVPIGVIAVIYEARPNVTADSAVLCLKSGNACILRGGREAIHSSAAIAEVMITSSSTTRMCFTIFIPLPAPRIVSVCGIIPRFFALFNTQKRRPAGLSIHFDIFCY